MSSEMAPQLLPLVASDVAYYNSVPDGKLFLDDFLKEGRFDEERFEEFVWRYVQTDDQGVRAEFLDRMEYPLWKRVGETIRGWGEEGRFDRALSSRVEYILNHEFPDREVRGSAETAYSYRNDTEGGSSYSVNKATQSVSTGGSLSWEHPFHRSLYFLNGSLLADRNYQLQRQTVEGAGFREETGFLGAGASGTTGIRDPKDEGFRLSVGGSVRRFFEPPSDSLDRSYGLSALSEARQIVLAGRPFSATLSGAVVRERFTKPPEISGLHHRRNDSRSVKSEFTYQFSRFGLVLDSSVVASDFVRSYTAGNSFSWGLAPLVQYTGGQGYLRGGVDFARQEGEYTGVGDDEPIVTKEQKAGGQAAGEVRITPLLLLNSTLSAAGNKSEGTFVGWYPSWAASLSLFHAPRRWTNSLVVQYGGSRVDLNEFRESYNLSAQLGIGYRPRDWLRFSLSPTAAYARVTGFEASVNRSAGVGGSVAYNLLFFDRLWISASSGAMVADYRDDEGNLLEASSWWVGTGLSLTL